jgi:hypothetical protein
MTDDTGDSFARYEEQEKRRKALAAELRKATKAKLFDILQAAGIASLTVTFDGEGDSGQIDEISAFSKANTPLKLPRQRLTIQTAKHDGTGPDEASLTVEEVIEHLCYALLEDHHEGWEINEGAYGEFVFDVVTGEITLTFNYRISDVETSTHTF